MDRPRSTSRVMDWHVAAVWKPTAVRHQAQGKPQIHEHGGGGRAVTNPIYSLSKRRLPIIIYLVVPCVENGVVIERSSSQINHARCW